MINLTNYKILLYLNSISEDLAIYKNYKSIIIKNKELHKKSKTNKKLKNQILRMDLIKLGEKEQEHRNQQQDNNIWNQSQQWDHFLTIILMMKRMFSSKKSRKNN